MLTVRLLPIGPVGWYVWLSSQEEPGPNRLRCRRGLVWFPLPFPNDKLETAEIRKGSSRPPAPVLEAVGVNVGVLEAAVSFKPCA